MAAKIQGRFKPDSEKSDRWERVAGARGREQWPAMVANRVARTTVTQRNNMNKTPASDDASEVTRIAGAGLEPATPAL